MDLGKPETILPIYSDISGGGGGKGDMLWKNILHV